MSLCVQILGGSLNRYAANHGVWNLQEMNLSSDDLELSYLGEKEYDHIYVQKRRQPSYLCQLHISVVANFGSSRDVSFKTI